MTEDGSSNGTVLNGTGSNPDLHYKMCKKIAQLTKVIFHLHTKTESHDYNMRELALSYEQQLEDVSDYKGNVQ